MMRYGLITEQSRKSRAARSLYELIRNRGKSGCLPEQLVGNWSTKGGFQVTSNDRFRVLDLRLHDEHMSPYFKTDMSLFHLLMLDDSVNMSMFKTDEGILFVFDGVRESPEPFGQQGHDFR